jgi:hypothetical protein
MEVPALVFAARRGIDVLDWWAPSSIISFRDGARRSRKADVEILVLIQ